MYYIQVYVRNVRDIYTWESPDDIPVGSRVMVNFRNQKKIGVTLSTSDQKPDFKTQPVLEVIEERFINEKYLAIAKEIASENFTRLPKVLSLMIPEAFFTKQNPVKRRLSYKIVDTSPSLRGPKQKQAFDLITGHNGPMPEEKLKKDISTTVIKSLITKEVIEPVIGKIVPGSKIKTEAPKNITLNQEQEQAIKFIMTSSEPTVLWGVTGSGKTEIYKTVAKKKIQADPTAQILLLLPEIALTPQLISEFTQVFGQQVAVWHSNMTKTEKVQEYERIRTGEAQVLIGTRSSVMTNAINPKLIILDEEHEWTFKNESNPRYWTHDWVEKLRKQFGCKLIFGSATPRLSTLHKITTDNYQLVQLTQKVHQTKLPHIGLVDLAQEAKKGNYTPLSEELIRQLKDIKKRGKQAVLFLNKRGYSGSTMCKACGTYFECPNCSANMKLHRNTERQRLICHTCGHLEFFKEQCPDCNTKDFVFRGWGTQQVETEIKSQLPGFTFLRADADSVSGRYDFEKLLTKFHNHDADILLGTQMIAKGLDFENVELVGVILADVGLSLPDFRAEERVFQLLTQVSGRAGRRETAGKIVIQTFHPDEPIFKYLQTHDIKGFYQQQFQQRESNQFPPFTALAKLTISDRDKADAFKTGKELTETLTKKAPQGIQIQFVPAFFPRSHNKYHFHIFIRTEKKADLLEFLEKQDLSVAKVDIDPSSLL